jgi:DNA-binding GntR family transcriptional regulator
VSLADAIEITQARGALEGLVARLAAERATTDERTELRELVAEMERAVAIDARSEYAALNRALHRSLLQIARHTVANDLVANLRNRSAHHQYRLATVAGRAVESLEQHRAIVTAVVAGDGDAAEAAMRAHLESVTAVLRHWEELGVPG